MGAIATQTRCLKSTPSSSTSICCYSSDDKPSPSHVFLPRKVLISAHFAKPFPLLLEIGYEALFHFCFCFCNQGSYLSKQKSFLSGEFHINQFLRIDSTRRRLRKRSGTPYSLPWTCNVIKCWGLVICMVD